MTFRLPGALEGMLKSCYWKPSIKYTIDKIIVFNKIDFMNVRRNEVKREGIVECGKESDEWKRRRSLYLYF